MLTVRIGLVEKQIEDWKFEENNLEEQKARLEERVRNKLMTHQDDIACCDYKTISAIWCDLKQITPYRRNRGCNSLSVSWPYGNRELYVAYVLLADHVW